MHAHLLLSSSLLISNCSWKATLWATQLVDRGLERALAKLVKKEPSKPCFLMKKKAYYLFVWLLHLRMRVSTRANVCVYQKITSSTALTLQPRRAVSASGPTSAGAECEQQEAEPLKIIDNVLPILGEQPRHLSYRPVLYGFSL